MTLLSFACAPRLVASNSTKLPAVGVVFNAAPLAELGDSPINGNAVGFVQGMRERGWTPGGNVRLLWRSAEGDYARLPGIIRELVAVPVDVLVVVGNVIALAAKALTRTIPIVMTGSESPVEAGLVASSRRPGGNVTGLHWDGTAFAEKRLAILREMIPATSLIARLEERQAMEKQGHGGGSGDKAPRFGEASGVRMVRYIVEDLADVDQALADARRRQAGAAIFADNALFLTHARPIALLCERHRMPAMFANLSNAREGGLAAYAVVFPDAFRAAAGYVDRILRGAHPRDLPLEAPSRFHLHVNMKTARALGVEMPMRVLLQAERVFE